MRMIVVNSDPWLQVADCVGEHLYVVLAPHFSLRLVVTKQHIKECFATFEFFGCMQ